MNNLRFEPPEPIRKSLDISWKEGIAGNAMIVLIENYLTPFALFLGASAQAVGFLVAVPHLLGAVSQLAAVRAVRFSGTRLRFLIDGTRVQALLLVPVAALAFINFPGRIPVLILLISAFRILANLIQTAWGSLVSDYLPPEERGRYFGWRSQVVGAAGIAVLALAGGFLYLSKKYSLACGFFLVFLAAAAFRTISSSLFRSMTDVPHQPAPGSDFTFLMFLRRFRESNFVKYVLYVSGVTFAAQIASPYFSVYMLRDLHFNYVSYMLVQTASLVSGLVAFPLWGRHADIAGNARVLKTTSFLIPAIPVLWMLSARVEWIILVEIFSGFVWGGFNLCAANFIYDAVSPAKRVRCLGYFNLINGFAVFTGAALGGFLAERLPHLLGYRLLTLFLLSAAARLAVHFFLSGKFREVRAKTEKASSIQLFFSVLGIRPMTGRNLDWETPPFSKPY